MKSKKLSNTERKELVESLVKSAFKKQDAKILKMINDFGERLYKKFVSPLVPAMIRLEKAEKSYVCYIASIKVQSNEYYRRIWPKFDAKLLFLSRHDMIPRLDAAKHKKEYNHLQKIFQAEDRLKEEKATSESKTNAALNSVRTTKQLSDMWPEAFDLYEKLFPPAEKLLPDVRRDDLNKLLGLKTIKEAPE